MSKGIQLIDSSKPRELLENFGAKSLSTKDLLAIVLRVGSKHESVFQLSERILKSVDNLYQLKQMTLDELMSINGIGRVRAIELQAIIELGFRIHQTNQLKFGKIISSQSAGEYLIAEMKDFEQEHFVVLFLNTKNQIIGKKTLFIGSANQSIADPRDIFKSALKNGAIKLIVAHNHPSGDVTPSKEDINLTKKLVEIGELMCLPVLDHIIVGDDCYLSMREDGYI